MSKENQNAPEGDTTVVEETPITETSAPVQESNESGTEKTAPAKAKASAGKQKVGAKAAVVKAPKAAKAPKVEKPKVKLADPVEVELTKEVRIFFSQEFDEKKSQKLKIGTKAKFEDTGKRKEINGKEHKIFRFRRGSKRVYYILDAQKVK